MSKGKAVHAAALSAVGIVGSVLWQKKDLLKAIAQLHKYPEGWVQIQHTPEVFLTKTSEKNKENLFEHIRHGQWRLVDHVADGYFWMNSREEVLLLTQKKAMKDYWTWTASRPIFGEVSEPEQDIIDDEALIRSVDEF